MSKLPSCKSMKNTVVRIPKTVITKCGEIYYEGEHLVCRRMTKDGTMHLYRPGTGMITQHTPDYEIIGDAKKLYGV